MEITLCILIALPLLGASQDTLPEFWQTQNTPHDRTNCIPVESYAVYQSGAFSNGVGTPLVKFCATNSCGVRGRLATVNVVDWLSVVSNGDSTRRISVGSDGYEGDFIQIPPNTTQSYPSKGVDLAFTGPIDVRITTSSITVTRLTTGDDGDMTFSITMESPEVILESNSLEQTVWNIDMYPDHYCPGFTPLQSIVLCSGAPLLLRNPCPDPDLWVIWELPDGTIIEGKDSLLLDNPTAGSYYGSTPCQSWEVRVVDPYMITILQEPIMCSNRTRLSLPIGIDGIWSTGESGRSIEVTQGDYYVDIISTCGTYRSDTISVSGSYNAFDFTISIHPDTNRVLLTSSLSVWATTNRDTNEEVVIYHWQKDGTTHTDRIIGAGMYTITAYYDGCIASDTIEVLAGPIPGCDFPIYAPNAFSPDDDNREDEFYLSPPSEGIVNSLTIFSRWGEKVFESKNPGQFQPKWDGMFRGQTVQPNVYVWYASVTVGFQVCQIRGTVTAIR
jgi:gliding motility-associated-like protein